MNGPGDTSDYLTPAEQRLYEHLAVLREDAPHAPATIVKQVARSARWQRAIRRPMIAIGALSATVTHALALLLKPPAGHP